MTLKVGDVVVLNSGGPDMTVALTLGSVALCKWHSSSPVQQQEALFYFECLTNKDPSDARDN